VVLLQRGGKAYFKFLEDYRRWKRGDRIITRVDLLKTKREEANT